MGGGLRFVDEESVRKNMRLSISRRIFYVVICWIKNLESDAVSIKKEAQNCFFISFEP